MRFDNSCRFMADGAGHYEVWFFTLNDPNSKSAFWFRYALDAEIGSNVATPSLWAMFFDGGRTVRPFGILNAFPERSWSSAEGAVITIGAAAFAPPSLTGRASDDVHSIDWDLSFEQNVGVFEHVNPRMQAMVRPKSHICAPSLATRFHGSVCVDGRTYPIDNAPGCQQHLWGRKHAETWAWAHCNAFENEPDAVFEGLAARTRVGPIRTPPITMIYLRCDGVEYRFNTLWNAMTTRNRFGQNEWRFIAGNRTTRLRGVARGDFGCFLQVGYVDPDGNRTFCINSELANLELVLEKRANLFGVWSPYRTLSSNATTHFELASRTLHPDVDRYVGPDGYFPEFSPASRSGS